MSDPIVPVGGGVPVDPETGERYGYLPRRAASRKLIIRANLGLGWLLGAAAAALVIAVVAVAYVASRPDTPGGRYVDAGPLSAYPEGAVAPLQGVDGWLDRRDGLRAVVGASAYCPADGGWVLPDGGRTDRSARGLSLLPVRAAGGRVYVDPTAPRLVPGVPPSLPSCPGPVSSPP